MFLSRPLRKNQTTARRRKRHRRSIWLSCYYLMMGINSVILSSCKYGCWQGRLVCFPGSGAQPDGECVVASLCSRSLTWLQDGARDCWLHSSQAFVSRATLIPWECLGQCLASPPPSESESEMRCLDTPPSGHLRGCNNVNTDSKLRLMDLQQHSSISY